MQYTAILLLGEEAPDFLEQWEGGGVPLGERAAALFYAARGAHSLVELRRAAAMWELEAAHFELKELLAVGLKAPWRWQRLGWPEASGRAHHEAYARLQRLIGSGAHEHAADVLRLAAALARRLGPPHHVKGRTASDPEDEITIFASGLVTYGRTPHPAPVLQAAAEQAQGAPISS